MSGTRLFWIELVKYPFPLILLWTSPIWSNEEYFLQHKFSLDLTQHISADVIRNRKAMTRNFYLVYNHHMHFEGKNMIIICISKYEDDSFEVQMDFDMYWMYDQYPLSVVSPFFFFINLLLLVNYK